eukprot:scaffold192_cov320-Ochromonas_danica.AAC.10
MASPCAVGGRLIFIDWTRLACHGYQQELLRKKNWWRVDMLWYPIQQWLVTSIGGYRVPPISIATRKALTRPWKQLSFSETMNSREGFVACFKEAQELQDG